MPLDGISAKCLANELNIRLADARIDKIYQPDRYDILLVLRTRTENLKLILSANPSAPRIHLTTETRDNPKEPPMFCMLLRKHLTGARMLSVETPGYERIFIFKFLTSNELGDTLEKSLIIEVMGRHSNIILVNQEGRIHDAILHIDDSVSRLREIMPARRYILPSNQAKQLPSEALEKLKNNQSPFLPEVSTRPLEKALLESVQGFSPQLSRDSIEKCGLDPRQPAHQLTAAQQQKLFSSLIATLEQILAGQFMPTTYYQQPQDNIPFDFHAIVLNSLANPKLESSLSDAMDRFYLERNRQNRLSQQRQSLQRRIEQEIDATTRKFQIHQQELTEGEKRDTYKQFGELLISQLHLVPAAVEAVELPNFYDPDLKPVQIPLLPKLTPNQNAQRYFKLYQKARVKYEMNSKAVVLDQQDLEWLESLKSALSTLHDEQDLQAIREEITATDLFSNGRREVAGPVNLSNERDFMPGKPGSRSKRQAKYNQQGKPKSHIKSAAKNPPPLPVRSFISSDGLLIQAGRNNLQNDKLTLRTAQKDDLWLHAKKIPGTHVIIRCGKLAVPNQTLEEAAQIAAWFSQAQSSPKVAIDFCPVNQVKKIAGARPGLVQYEHYQTILVAPKDPITFLKAATEQP